MTIALKVIQNPVTDSEMIRVVEGKVVIFKPHNPEVSANRTQNCDSKKSAIFFEVDFAHVSRRIPAKHLEQYQFSLLFKSVQLYLGKAKVLKRLFPVGNRALPKI